MYAVERKYLQKCIFFAVRCLEDKNTRKSAGFLYDLALILGK
jgi:hypothetical protein